MKKTLALLSAAALALSLLAGCGASSSAPVVESQPVSTSTAQPEAPSAPKYVFLFIGDGMTYPQFQAASYYLGAKENKSEFVTGGTRLNFMDFPVAGSVTTFDSTSFAPDSASTATSIATGYKTHSGVINMDESKTVAYSTIAEQLKAQKDFKIGIVSSVNINHATPAAFYAHQPTRGNYYEIGEELIASGFDYFAGGALLRPTGNEKDKPDLYELAAAAGYTVTKTKAEAEALTAASGKALVIAEDLADSSAMAYELDRADDALSLADYVSKGVELLENDNGFFMMVEGGKIDWACHANDAGAAVYDVLALADAVDVALDFAKKHPEETLILVTGDHETGGLSIGFAGTNYDTYLDNLQYQQISYAKFDSDYVNTYVETQASFADAMVDVAALFGLTLPENAADAPSETLVLNDYEVGLLQEAYAITLAGGFTGDNTPSQAQRVQYGSYNPFSVTVTHLLNNKSGIGFTSYSHTGLPSAVFATGIGSEAFGGGYDNTEIYTKLADLLAVK